VRTIAIDALGVKTTEFDLGDAEKDALYESGRSAAETFLRDWSFDDYIEHFRTGAVSSRRQNLNRLMAS
jgi:NTE family protein